MCVGFLNLFCWSFALLVTMWVRWRGFAELRLNTAYGNAFCPSTSEELSDSIAEFNANVAGQLFHPLILTPQWVSGPSGRSQVWFHQKMLAKGLMWPLPALILVKANKGAVSIQGLHPSKGTSSVF